MSIFAKMNDFSASEVNEALKRSEINPSYHFFGHYADEADGNQFFDRSGNGNDAERGANLSVSQMFANSGYISTIDPTSGTEDSVLRMPNINLDYAGGEKLIVFWRGIITPEAGNRRFIGDGEGSYAGFGIRVNSDGKLSLSITDGTTAAFSGNSSSTAFEAGVPHDILVALDGESNRYGFIIDGEYDPITTDYIVLAGGSGMDTRNANTINIGSAFPASEASDIGVATQTRRLDVLKLDSSYNMPALSVLRDVARQARINPTHPITRAAF